MKYLVSGIISILGALFIFFNAYKSFSLRDNDAGLMFVLSGSCFVFVAINSYLKYKKDAQ